MPKTTEEINEINIRKTEKINKTKCLLFNKIGNHLTELTEKKRQKYQITKMKVEILLLILKDYK